MRWEQLFADLESRFADLTAAEERAELADRQRERAGAVTMVQRCAGAIGATLRIRTRGGRTVAGVLRTVGPDWLLLDPPGQGEVVVALGAVTAMEGLGVATGQLLSAVESRLNLRWALRGLARDRAPVAIAVTGAPDPGGGAMELSGTVDRVGSDFVEVAQHPVWEVRRAGDVRSVALVPLTAVDIVRSVPAG